MRPQVYYCSFCDRSFQTLQALGGHQTRHRREIRRMRHESGIVIVSQRLNPKVAPITIDLLSLLSGESMSMANAVQVENNEELDLTLRLGTANFDSVLHEVVGENEVDDNGIDLTLRL